MRLAARAAIAEDREEIKQFTAEEFRSVTRAHFFMGAVSFSREVERLTHPEEAIRIHARSALRIKAA